MMAPEELFHLCQEAVTENVSDIHLKPDSLPFCRDNDGRLRSMASAPVDEDAIIGVCRMLLSKNKESGPLWTTFEEEHDVTENPLESILRSGSGEADVSAAMLMPDSSTAWLRINAYYAQAGFSVAIRVLRNRAMSAEEIWLPKALGDLRYKKEGLIIFCGPTGSGKTTAMYSMLDAINHEECKHIVTLDDPLEIILKEDKCIISQREIGMHTKSFSTALRSALREDPDILLIGEMRDRDTIRTALQAAETGHLVLSTIHASSVSEVVDRILSYFDADDAPQIRSVLAASFLGIAGCRLLSRKGGGRVAAFEVLLRTAATTTVIKNGNMMQIADYMSREQGMQTMEQAIEMLRISRLIDGG